MYEVELKVRADHEGVRTRLADLGAQRLGTVVQIDTYYDAPHRDFAETDEALRLRQESPEDDNSRAYLTYKGPLVDEQSKTRREAETAVGDESTTDDVLSGLGFEPAATVHKERERYALDGCTITLDAVEGLGEFVEVEVASDVESTAGIEDARERAFDALERLGLASEDTIRTSYLGLLLESDES